MVILLTTIKIEQVADLEAIFAVLTAEGWVIPEWLRLLRKQVQFNAIGSKVEWMLR